MKETRSEDDVTGCRLVGLGNGTCSHKSVSMHGGVRTKEILGVSETHVLFCLLSGLVFPALNNSCFGTNLRA